MVQLYILQFVLTYISVHLNKKPRRRSEFLFAAHKFNTSLMLNDCLAVMYSIRVPRTTVLKFCSNHLLRRRLGGRAEVRTARHLGPSQSGNCFDLEDVTSNVGGTGRKLVYKHRSRASARSGSTASPCRGRVLHVAAFGYTLLEIVPLSLSRGSPAACWLRGVRLDRQRTTGLGEFCADRGCPV